MEWSKFSNGNMGVFYHMAICFDERDESSSKKKETSMANSLPNEFNGKMPKK